MCTHCIYLFADLSSNGFSLLSEEPSDGIKNPFSDKKSDNLVDCHESKMEKFKLKRRWPLSPNFNIMEKTPSNVILRYLDLFDRLLELLQSMNPKEIVKSCKSVMASDSLGLSYFSPEFITMLELFTNTTSLIRILFPYTNWYDHSIIRKVVETCDFPEGIKLLDEFDSRIDVTLPIKLYPIPTPSDLTIPDESGTHTVMAVKYVQQLSSLSLQHIGVVKSLIIDKFCITKHACVLLAVANHDSAMFFWLIPKNIVSTIAIAVQEHSTSLYDKGLLEIAIYPQFAFSTGNTSRIWTMAYHNDTTAMLKHVSGKLVLAWFPHTHSYLFL